MANSSPSWAALTTPVEVPDPLAASEGLGVPTFAWERRSSKVVAVGFGAADAVDAQAATLWSTLDRLATSGQVAWLNGDVTDRPPGPWFGGIAFDVRRACRNGWQEFPPSRWVLPELLVWKRAGQSYATVFRRVDDAGQKARQAMERALSDAARRLSLEANGASDPSGEIPLRRELAIHSDRTQWFNLMDRALAGIAAGSLEKVVIARAIDVESPIAFEPRQLVSALREDSPNCTTFLVRGGEESFFVGATPEMLCRWSDLLLETEALAGSAPLADGQTLLRSDKENREHLAVIEGITSALRPLSQSVTVEKSPALFRLRHLFHLRTGISAHLRPGARVSEVVSALHPTPAVGGAPRDKALGFLAEHEGLERGWYGGAVGWLGEGGVELAVAIRSALVRDRLARIFVGAGVVAGSTPEGEWEETETKGLTMLAALGGPRARG